MRATKSIIPVDGVGLRRMDLVDFEHALESDLKRFVKCSSCRLYFPKTLPKKDAKRAGDGFDPVYLAKEKRLLLPLVYGERLMGYFVVRGVSLKAPKTAPGYLKALGSMLMEKLALYKASVSDNFTGMNNRDYFFSQLVHEIDLVKCTAMGGTASRPDRGMNGFRGCLGVVFFDLDRFQRINEEYGYSFGDSVLMELGVLMKKTAPANSVLARYGEDKFALLVPEAKPKGCFQLGELVRQAIRNKEFECPVPESGPDVALREIPGKGGRMDDAKTVEKEEERETFRVNASVGYSNYPQDLAGRQIGLDSTEQARILVRKAILGMKAAKEHGRSRVFAFADIVSQGGSVLESLPMDRVRISLGTGVDAAEGMRFLAFSPKYDHLVPVASSDGERNLNRPPSMCQGEIVLTDVRFDVAYAEILYQSDPSRGIKPGDKLTLIQEKESLLNDSDPGGGREEARLDETTGLASYSDFIRSWTNWRQHEDVYTLALMRLVDLPRGGSATFQRRMNELAGKVAELARRTFGDEVLGARYSLSSLVLAFCGQRAEDLQEGMREFVKRVRVDLRTGLGVGLASHPCLSFSPADTMDNARKALEHALMLPDVRVAAFDSVSLNVSADRMWVEGDVYGAIQEYRMSLLADENNALAHNSLGVCYASLGKFADAATHFQRTVSIDPEDVMSWYNLGRARQRIKDFDAAREAFEACRKLDAGHVYSMLQLGILAEREGDVAMATGYYSRARDMDGGEPLAMRHLARLAVGGGDHETAREYLHQALVHNHKDAYSLNLLANLYLDGGEDPQIAEALARQCVALRPGNREYLETLARALESQGKDEEKVEVLARTDH